MIAVPIGAPVFFFQWSLILIGGLLKNAGFLGGGDSSKLTQRTIPYFVDSWGMFST